MTSIWTGQFDNNEIKVENTWFHGERLYVNNILQDETYGFTGTKLLGHLFDKDRNKLHIKANLGGVLKITCNVFVDDRKVEITQNK